MRSGESGIVVRPVPHRTQSQSIHKNKLTAGPHCLAATLIESPRWRPFPKQYTPCAACAPEYRLGDRGRRMSFAASPSSLLPPRRQRLRGRHFFSRGEPRHRCYRLEIRMPPREQLASAVLKGGACRKKIFTIRTETCSCYERDSLDERICASL